MNEHKPAPALPAVRRFVVHVGLPKTASTLLQERVFPAHPSIAFLEGRAGNDVADRLTSYLQSPDDRSYDIEAACRLLDGAVAKAPFDRSVLVLSRESLAAGGRAERGLVAARLFDLLGPSTILLLVRNPCDMVESMFLQDLKGVGTMPGTGKNRIVGFGDWFAQQWAERDTPGSRLQRLLYHHVACAFADRFGHGNVCVIPFELLRQDRRAFADRLATCLGVDAAPIFRAVQISPVNPRVTGIDQIRARLMARSPTLTALVSHLTPAPLRRAIRASALGKPAKLALTDEIATRIAEFAAPDCAALACDWNLDLSQYGYPLA